MDNEMEALISMYWTISEEKREKILEILPTDEMREQFKKMAGLWRVLHDKEYKKKIGAVLIESLVDRLKD